MIIRNVLPSAGFGLATILSLTAITQATPPVIDDVKISEGLVKFMSSVAETKDHASADELAKKANQSNLLKLDIPEPKTSTPAGNDYDTLSESVFLIDTIFKCGKCSKWHQGATATAWCLSEDGLMVTNAHVFRGAKGAAMGVTNRKGLCLPVTELLGYDVAADVAIFRVKGTGLKPLKLGATADVGKQVSIISNPSGNLFVRTEGSVSRYSVGAMGPKTPPVPWMSVTADYAKGSSGGPVFNNAGEVVGMVSSTRSIYTGVAPGQMPAKGSETAKNPEAAKGDLQMVIKNCVPVDAIRALFKQP